MSLAAPGTNPASNLELKLPHTIGSANQLLKVDGSGQLGWATDSTTDSTKLPLAGGTLTGNLTAVKYLSSKSSGAALSFADSVEINLGTGDDLKLWHQTGNSYITSTGANLTLRAAGHLYLQDIDGNTMADFNDGGAVELYHNGNKAAATASDDFDVYRRLRLFAARDMSGHQLSIGQWDGSNHRIEGDANRPIFITAYNSSGIKFGYQSGEKVQIDNSGLKIVLGGYLDFYSGRTTYRHTGSVGEFKNNTGDLYCAAAGDLKFYTDNSFSTERLRIKTTGEFDFGYQTNTAPPSPTSGGNEGLQIYATRHDSSNFFGTIDFVAGRGSDNTNGGAQMRFFTQKRAASTNPVEALRITADGVFNGRALINREFGTGNGYFTTSGAWKVILDLGGYPDSCLYICDVAMQHSAAYTATFWVYKTENDQYKVIHDQDSLCHWRINGSQLEVQQNSGVDQTNTFGYQKIFQAFGMATPY